MPPHYIKQPCINRLVIQGRTPGNQVINLPVFFRNVFLRIENKGLLLDDGNNFSSTKKSQFGIGRFLETPGIPPKYSASKSGLS